MNHDDEAPLSAEEIDERIDFATQRLRSKPAWAMPGADLRLIEDMQRAYPADDEEMTRALERVRQRLAQDVPEVSAGRPGQRRRRASRPDVLDTSGVIPPRKPLGSRQRNPFPARMVALVAAVLLVTVIGSLVAGIILVRKHSPVAFNQPTAQPGQTVQPTQPPAPAEIAYIGSDGNVWMMTWPDGTPQRLTTDAQTGSLTYYGLAWSPDGSLLAVEKVSGSPYSYALMILKPDGTVVVNEPLPGGSVSDLLFAWSPDGTMLAFRGKGGGELPDGTHTGKLFIFDAHTGKTLKTLTFTTGGTGCGGAGPFDPLTGEIWTAHHLSWEYYSGDTFAWSPDGHNILVSEFCSQAGAGQVNLNTGDTSLPYPSDGSYQPGGNLILGYWHDGTLGLTDLSANHVRALVKPEFYANPPQYAILLGTAAWTSDGQTIYYEHDDGIWQIGVDASNPHQVVAGTAFDSEQNATVQLVPSPSPDGHMLLYLQVVGSNRAIDNGDPTPPPTPTIPLTAQWYVAQADGSNPAPLPQGVKEAAWRPGT